MRCLIESVRALSNVTTNGIFVSTNATTDEQNVSPKQAE
jgi:hypothetical protein